jgi:hypothetical protein
MATKTPKEKKPFQYSDAQIASLKQERETYKKQGKAERVKAVDAELKSAGEKVSERADTPPAGATTPAGSSNGGATTPNVTR